MAQNNKFQNTPELLALLKKYPDKEALNEADLPTKEIVEAYHTIEHGRGLINKAVEENPDEFDTIMSEMQAEPMENLAIYIEGRLAWEFIQIWEEAEV